MNDKRHITSFIIALLDAKAGSAFELTPIPPDGFDQHDTCVALPPTLLENRAKPLVMFQWHWSKRVAYD